ncbi:hypothetical protein CPB97_006915 [Podila verticillata]|nr:hypothetical protein CPB97_006915 [Podila verticillata]
MTMSARAREWWKGESGTKEGSKRAGQRVKERLWDAVDVEHGSRSQVTVAKTKTYDTKDMTNRNITLHLNMELTGLEAKSQVCETDKELFDCIDKLYDDYILDNDPDS